MGSEMSGGIENVTITNVTYLTANKPGNIKVGNMRGGYVKNIVYQDIVVVGEIEQAIHVDAFHYNDSPNPSCDPNWKPPHLPYVSDIYFQRIDGTRATITGNETYHFYGYNETPIKYLYIEEVYFPLPVSGGIGWNCTGVQGTTKKSSVAPWPPCPEVGILTNELRGSFNGGDSYLVIVNTWLNLGGVISTGTQQHSIILLGTVIVALALLPSLIRQTVNTKSSS